VSRVQRERASPYLARINLPDLQRKGAHMTCHDEDPWLELGAVVVVMGVLAVVLWSLTSCTTPPPLPEPHGPVYLTNPAAIRSLRECGGRYPASWCEPSR
jgi:hypothetical protein